MLTVNFQSRTTVYQQLYDDVVRLASLGVLKSNTKLPPVRVLATELGINPNTVSKAYKMLELMGIYILQLDVEVLYQISCVRMRLKKLSQGRN